MEKVLSIDLALPRLHTFPIPLTFLSSRITRKRIEKLEAAHAEHVEQVKRKAREKYILTQQEKAMRNRAVEERKRRPTSIYGYPDIAYMNQLQQSLGQHRIYKK